MSGSREQSTDKERSRPPAKRKRRWAIPLLLILLLFLFFAPKIATSGIVLDFFLNRYNAGWSGRIEVGRAEVGWSKSLTLDNVEVYDAEGESILSLPHAQSDRSFWNLLTNRNQLGTWTLDGPVGRSTVQSGILHIEPLLLELFPPSDGPTSPMNIVIEAEDAWIELVDAETGTPWIAENLTIHCAIHDETDTPFQVAIEGLFSTDSDEPPGEFKLQLAWSPNAEAVESDEMDAASQTSSGSSEASDENGDFAEGNGSYEGRIAAQRLPLSLFNILFARNGLEDRLRGDTRGDIAIHSSRMDSWRDFSTIAAWRFSGDCEAVPFEAGLAVLGGKKFTPAFLGANGTVIWAAPRIHFDSRFRSDIFIESGENEIKNFDLYYGSPSSWMMFLDVLLRDTARISFDVDLARLAAALPETLDVREGMTITSGRLSLSLGSAPPTGPPPDGPQTGVASLSNAPESTASPSQYGSPFSSPSATPAVPVSLDPATLGLASSSDRTLRGDLEIADIQATQDGRLYSWEQPINIDFAVRHNETSLRVEHFLCEADFLTANVQGNRSNLSADLEFDLGKLAEQANQFLDLEEMTLQGVGRGVFTWTLDAQQRFSLDAGAAIQNLHFQPFASNPTLAFNEPVINTRLTASGRMPADVSLIGSVLDSTIRCERASLVASNNTEQLVLQFLGSEGDVAASEGDVAGSEGDVAVSEGVPLLRSMLGPTPWEFTIEANGSLRALQTRLAAWINNDLLRHWTFDGTFQTQGGLRIVPGGAVIENLDTSISSLVLTDGQGMRLTEPQATLLVDGFRWDSDESIATIDSLLLQDNNTLAGLIETFSISWPRQDEGQSFLASGACGMSASLDRIWPLIASHLDANAETSSLSPGVANPNVESSFSDWNLTGVLRADLGASRNGDATAFQIVSSIEGFTAQRPGIAPIAESTLRMDAQGEYRGESQVLNLETLTVGSDTLAANARGELRLDEGDVDEDPLADILAPSGGASSSSSSVPIALVQSNVTVSWPRLVAYLPAKYADRVTISGVRENSFTFQGPLTSPFNTQFREATSDLQFGWDAADFYGFVVGASNFHAVLSNGVLRCDPQELSVSEGVLRRLPSLEQRPDGSDWEVTIEPGVFVENVRINPKMAANGLQYIAPIMAGVTETEGRFSIELADCRIPLKSPELGRLQGRLFVHDILLGPGPMLQQFAVLFQFNETVPIARDTAVNFELRDGRVYHDNLIFMLDNARVYTSGSVGLDKTLQLTAVMPIPDSWIRREPRLQQALQGQTITIPITGTLSSPRLDERALQDAFVKAVQDIGVRYIEDEIRGTIEDELGRGLQNLFGQ